jgi:hypothetical protein
MVQVQFACFVWSLLVTLDDREECGSMGHNGGGVGFDGGATPMMMKTQIRQLKLAIVVFQVYP